MREFFYPLPIPLVIGIMFLGLVLVLLSCAPTAWVDRAHRKLEKRDQKKP